MAKRRNVLAGLGALAMGSGALITQASFEHETEIDGASFRIVAAPGLSVRRGAAFDDDSGLDYDAYTGDDTSEDFIDGSGIDYSNLKPSDVPLAYADGNENGDLTIQVARMNNATSVDFDDLLEIENTGSTDEDVGITYTGGYAQEGVTPSWWEDNSYDESNSSQLNKGHVQQIFQFRTGGTRISSDYNNADEEPNNQVTLTPTDTIDVDLKTALTGDQVSILASESSGGNPFDSDPDTDNFELLDRINVGTDW